jgi:hypothetical protein
VLRCKRKISLFIIVGIGFASLFGLGQEKKEYESNLSFTKAINGVRGMRAHHRNETSNVLLWHSF